ncbi:MULTISPECIES: membrane protein insertion efficiency factor YidD [unclassified Methylobacterium]|uniref:membrane protein insertion efficiency factor YidD n=1 Tax=unclassified Methylobacterium TaxID=2615210 RepID=UPI0006FB64F6|nr:MULTISPECIES: membrane protein insertion efficiency factor YidD [unclassified Methylobacterium]KQP87299.1 membrane protein insertion efficiency factor [Methylobacterium sp. Leaf113]MCK2055683.1 membrane protein insertion efficiency factor YidD [Methylobacterium sp. 37f]
MRLRRVAHGAIRAYQLTLSSLIGRQCRHWPSCSTYTDEAIQRHGLWAGGWIGFARICRCGPLGTHGIDLVPESLPARATGLTPWRYGRWRGVNAPPSPFACEAIGEEAVPTRPS